MYSSSLANGGLCFLFKLPWLFDCGCLELVFDFFFPFSFDLEVDLCLLFVVCVSFFLVRFVVSFSVRLSIFLWRLFWSFTVSVLMWRAVWSRSSMSIGLKLLDNGIGSFISVFSLVSIFFITLFRGFFLILVVSLTFVWNVWLSLLWSFLVFLLDFLIH